MGMGIDDYNMMRLLLIYSILVLTPALSDDMPQGSYCTWLSDEIQRISVEIMQMDSDRCVGISDAMTIECLKIAGLSVVLRDYKYLNMSLCDIDSRRKRRSATSEDCSADIMRERMKVQVSQTESKMLKMQCELDLAKLQNEIQQLKHQLQNTQHLARSQSNVNPLE